MTATQRALAFFLVTAISACGAPQGDANTASKANSGTFTYAPTLNQPHRETMRRYEEVSIPGSPVRDAEQWTMEWDVVTTQESNLFKRSLKLVGLKLNVNGADQLRGDEVKASQATIDVLTDKDSNVADVRGADQFSAAIVALGTAEAQPVLKRVFSPERMKALAIVRSRELHGDFVGHPAAVGSQWMASGGDSGASRQIKVVGEAPCGAKKCLQVVRVYDIDREALYAEISERIAAQVKAQGGDPSKVKLAGAEVKVEDSLLIDPATMDYYGARFDEAATVRVAGPNGELPVAFKLRRESDFKY